MLKKAKPPAGCFISRIHAAQLLDCSVQLIDKFAKQGKVSIFHVGRKVVLRRDELIRLVEEGRL